MTTPLGELLADLPHEVSTTAREVREAHAQSSRGPVVFVVVDDDPTGTQSVSNLPVLTQWHPDDFRWAFGRGDAVYVMANTRSLGPDDARRVNEEIVAAALEAGESEGVEVRFVSRSDSTLRGHFPLEPDAIANAIGREVDGIVLVPAFPDAGRITVRGVHYAGNNDDGFAPVGETEFARDATFGYTSSVLSEWVSEKSEGRWFPEGVLHIDLEMLRGDLPSAVQVLMDAGGGVPIVCDAVCETDLRQLALALIEAEAAGKVFIYRVGPPFVRARIGQEIREPLRVDEVGRARREDDALAVGGLVVVGSHVGLTTRQLEVLETRDSPHRVTIDVRSVLGEGRVDYLTGLIDEVVAGLDSGTVVVATSRELVKGKDADDSLRIAREVSGAVIEVVQGVIEQKLPRFVIAKGGITSSDVATHGLGIGRATVVGPMLPGIVSLLRPEGGPAEGIPYVVFAGNVGDDESLATVTKKLSN